MRTITERHGGRGPRDFLNRDHMREVAHIGAVELFIHSNAMQAQRAHFSPKLWWKRVISVDLPRHRLHALLRPPMHHITQRVDVFAQIETH